jgi:PleD family two-component response regulator
MSTTYRYPAPYTALSSLISLFAGVGIWFIVDPALWFEGWLVIPVATLVVAIISLHMLRSSGHSAFEAGLAAAQTDKATRLPSHTIARQLLQREFAAAERGRDFSIALFTLDDLPRLAASRPHEAGRVLLSMGTILKRRTRGMNLSARWHDGYTFISVLGGVDEFGAQKFADKVTKDLTGLLVGGQPVTVRVAVAGYEHEMLSTDDLLAKARGALVEPVRNEEGLRIA